MVNFMQMYNTFKKVGPIYITKDFPDFDPLLNGRRLTYEDYQKLLEEEMEFERQMVESENSQKFGK